MRKTRTLILKGLLSIFTLLLLQTGFAQNQRTVTGTVRDTSGTGLPNVSVKVQGRTTGVVSDMNGIYSIKAQNGDVLEFSYVGYITEYGEVKGNIVDITMQPEVTIAGNEIVVTALGIRRENRKIGYGMTTIQGDDLAKTNTVNPVQSLQGQAPGVSITTSDGGLFGNSKIQLRGVSSLNSNNNQPIFVVDGVILENGISNASADWNTSSDDFGNMLKNLNPDDYKSVTVLRGAAATALYGSRGMNGAIIIVTKDGAGAKGIGVSIKQTLGIDHAYKIPDLQYEYGEGDIAGYISYGEKNPNGGYYRFDQNQFYLNDKGIPTKIGHPAGVGYGPKFDGRKIIDYDGTETTYSPNRNNLLNAYKKGILSTTSVALSGGNEKGNFYLSDAYTYRTGMLPNNKFERNSLLFSGAYNLATWLKAEASVSFTTSTSSNPRNDMAEYFIDGTFKNYYNTDKFKNKEYWQAAHGGIPNGSYGDKYADVPGKSLWFGYNLNNSVQKDLVTRPVVKLSAKVTDWLLLMLEGNMNYYTTKAENKELGSGYANDGGKYLLGHTEDLSKTGKFTANINKDINENWSFNLVAGGEMWKQDKSYTRSWTDGGLIVPGQYFLENSKKNILTEGKVQGNKQINSLYFLTNFGYKDQLFLDITGRNDWSSALVYSDGTGNNSYFYPSVSVSWLAHETFKLPQSISFAKLRTSWAQVGSDTDPFFINKGYTIGKYEMNGGNFVYTNGISSILVDKDIMPEKKNSFEVGADIRFFQNRLGFDFSFYNDIINNQIGMVPVESVVGYDNLLTNIGSLRNRGIELTVNAVPVKSTNGFRWNTTFNYWKNRTMVLNLHKDYGAYMVLGGHPSYGNFRVASVAYDGGDYGVLMSDSKPLVWQSKDDKGNNISDPRNGMKVLTWNDGNRGAFYTRSGKVEEVGKMQPDFEGSWINDLSYKGFNLSIQLDARFGGHMASFSNRYGTANGWLATSLYGRDAAHGGITWTSQYADTKGQTFTDGIIPEGIFNKGQMVTTPAGTKQDVGGMTYKEAYEKGYVEPVHASYYTYFNNSWSRGVVNDDWFSKVSYIALRNIYFGYNLPKKWISSTPIKNLTLGLNIRNVAYLHNSLPNHINPESFRGTSSKESFFERNFIPYTRSYTFTLGIDL
ncbi:SusC/RagA family TonB-linked outer membrane protein [Haoranjiania flava]|uniref:SusC/RagA family TonB-linked outer membrane protein n=1 Tax=Haoranjiania flava TaxID=1856322 RepID=A0AAE3IK73_9BACT|nr:SusC/RagA family TonB-linked outer membrane protein [Haoranjiania flava]MCU7693652.1 SusC/RagA family TonB-linked outer membrane protein [Haoranjiania flava]